MAKCQGQFVIIIEIRFHISRLKAKVSEFADGTFRLFYLCTVL